jgi:hypothetical protein
MTRDAQHFQTVLVVVASPLGVLALDRFAVVHLDLADEVATLSALVERGRCLRRLPRLRPPMVGGELSGALA